MSWQTGLPVAGDWTTGLRNETAITGLRKDTQPIASGAGQGRAPLHRREVPADYFNLVHPSLNRRGSTDGHAGWSADGWVEQRHRKGNDGRQAGSYTSPLWVRTTMTYPAYFMVQVRCHCWLNRTKANKFLIKASFLHVNMCDEDNDDEDAVVWGD